MFVTAGGATAGSLVADVLLSARSCQSVKRGKL